MSAIEERALAFECAGARLLGVLCLPASASPSTLGVIVVVGGPQYRVGSHRQFVLLARALARNGFPVLRFDYRGMGDSEGDLRSFAECTADIASSIDAMQVALPTVRRVVLWGLCDGASAALLHVDGSSDPRVAGLALLNPWVRSEASLARTHVKHYYLQRLREPAFWMKLLSGGVAAAAFTGLLRNFRKAFGQEAGGTAISGAQPFQRRMARGWTTFRGPVLLMLSGDDYTAREFDEHTKSDQAWRAALRAHAPLRVDLPGADHTCSQAAAREAVEAATADWLATACQGTPA